MSDFRIRVLCWWIGHDIVIPTGAFMFRPLWCRRCRRYFDAMGNAWRSDDA